LSRSERRQIEQSRIQMRSKKHVMLICLMFVMFHGLGCENTPGTSVSALQTAREPSRSNAVAVSSSYLEAALRDVLQQEVPVVRLASPNMCPGHFDLRPGQISELAKCRLLVRFDFQRALDAKLGERGSLQTLEITLPQGMCVPESYLSACRQIADHYVSMGEISRSKADNRLDEIADRISRMSDSIAKQIEAVGLNHAPALASAHQAEFCRWLGLHVAAVFSGADTAGTSEINNAVLAGEKAGVRIIIANEPEGRRLADALADRLGAKVVVFANFPQIDTELAFDGLLQKNLEALLDTARSLQEKK
ncbi:MAG: hypothetical protein ACWGMZ_10555, partial [Thermoguttaceae bacterium]